MKSVRKHLALKRPVFPFLYHYLTAEEPEKFLHLKLCIRKFQILFFRSVLRMCQESLLMGRMNAIDSSVFIQAHKILSRKTIREMGHHMGQHVILWSDLCKQKTV